MTKKPVAFAAILASAALCGSGVAKDIDMPARKPGAWEVILHLPSNHGSAQTMKLCTDAATDAAMFKFGLTAGPETCSRRDMQRSGDVVTMESECRMGNSTRTSRAVITFTGDTAYKTVVQTHSDPPMMGRADTTITQDAKWIGPCPADLQPGEIALPNGKKVNLKSIAK